ncbi:splicing factor U2AF large subunit, putative [Plasmodium gallinaceum]|uniref:Splicing factor U2AF large subunit, putative n=1 Tax=Plasmodium gallinaceum TaxID=5849 RepID=A0A1J1GQS0_PLAGA|nr:splicing factor U2AF large subunit, putative [Plasmodium gallinaceum]CRG94885.1 splicing factor U2AF large subunit, putative [Plasmodium gallinaceum]
MNDKNYVNNAKNVEKNNHLIKEKISKTNNIKNITRKESINSFKNNSKNDNDTSELNNDYNKNTDLNKEENDNRYEIKYEVTNSNSNSNSTTALKKMNGHSNIYEKPSEENNINKKNDKHIYENDVNTNLNDTNRKSEKNNKEEVSSRKRDNDYDKKKENSEKKFSELGIEINKLVEEKKNKDKNEETVVNSEINEKKNRKRSKEMLNNEINEKMKLNKEKTKSNEHHSSSIEQYKSKSKEKSRHRSKDRYKSKKRHKGFSSSGDELHSSKRKKSINRSKERSRNRSKNRSKEKYRNRSKEKSRNRSKNRYRSKEKSKNLSSSSSLSSEERHYHKIKKKIKKKNLRSSSDRNSNKSSSKSVHEKNERSVSSEVIKNKEVKQKKKTKWDTVDESLLKNNLLDNGMNSLLQKQNLALTNSLAQNSKVTQLNRNPYEMENDKRQRKLYIGNIPPNCKQEDVIDFFNGALLAVIKDTSLDVKIGDIQLMPVIKCEIFNIDSRFCFLEFRTIEITWLCLKLDSISFNNYCLRIGRPHDYVPPPEGDPALTAVFPDIDMKIFDMLKPSKNVYVKSGDDDNKLYIQNLPHDLKDDQIKDLLEQFGKLKAFNIIKDLNTGLNKGYGFFEYEDSACTQVAIHALNGFVCGQNILNVKKATFNKNQNNIYAQNPNNISIANNVEVPVSLLPNSISQKILSNSIIGLQIQASRKIGEKPSRVVQLTNAVFQEDLIIDSQYEEILREVKEEAEKYGPLQNIVIPKPNKDLSYTEGVGKIFLHYQDETTARKAQYMFNGRLFEKRVVCASFYSEDKFLKGKYVLS